MRTLDAGQASLAAQTSLSLVVLCKLTTYSDRAAGTVQSTRYFSDGARLYDWANLGTTRQFEPWLLKMDPGRDTMNHLPSMDGGGIESALRRRRTLTLRNWLPETATYLYQTLRAENLEHARIEIADLLLDRGAGQSWTDLTGFAGSEQTWTFRGEIASVLRVDEMEIELECVAELPIIPWIYANDASKNDPRDLGKPLPIVYGSAKHVPCIGWDGGRGYSTLAVAITKTSTSVDLTDATYFPTSGSAMIGTETISWTGKSGNQLTTVTRGVNSTRAVSHKLGEPVLETQTTAVFVAAGHTARAVQAVYARSPYNDAIVKVASSRYSANLADAATVSGQTVTSLSFTQANLRGLLSDLAQQLTEDASGANEQSETRSSECGTTLGNMFDGNLDNYDDLTSTRVQLNFPAVAGRTVTRVRFTVTASLDNGENIFFWAASSGGSAIGAITNDYGSTRNGVWEFETENATLCGATFWVNGGAATVRVYNMTRTEFFSGGPVRQRETQKPTLYNGATTSPYPHITDGVTDAGTDSFGTNGVAWTGPDITWPTAPTGRTVLACIYRIYAILETADILGICDGGDTTRYTQVANGTGANIEGWFEMYTERAGSIGTTSRLAGFDDFVVREVERVVIFTDDAAQAAIAAATIGPGLSLYADVDGYNAPSAAYIAGSGNLITEMPDVLRHLLTVVASPAQTVDATWNDIGGASYLDDNAHACDLRAYGERFADVLAGLAYEGRMNVVADERTAGTTYRNAAALSTYAWPASARTLAKWQELVEEGRDAESILTRFRYLWDWRADLGDAAESFLQAVQTTVTAAETKFGRHDAEAVGLRSVYASATATEISGFYEAARSSSPAVYTIRGVPWPDGYDLERMDIITFTPRWASAKKARLIETTRRLDALVDLRLVEVS